MNMNGILLFSMQVSVLALFQTTENRNTWAEEQQQEMLDKMRAALNEKDKTIEVTNPKVMSSKE